MEGDKNNQFRPSIFDQNTNNQYNNNTHEQHQPPSVNLLKQGINT